MSTPPPKTVRLRRRARDRVGRAPVAVAAGLALAATAGFAGRGLWAGAGRPAAATAAVPVSAAKVVRTDVSSRQVVPGTLEYLGTLGVIDEVGPGVVTWLPSAGSLVRRGQALFQLAGQPVILFYGP